MNNKLKALFLVVLMMLVAFSVSARGGNEPEEIELRFLTFMVGAHTETPWFTRTIDRFNE